MTNQEIDELLELGAESGERLERARIAYFESEEWRELLEMICERK
jgi:hypothetical protein